MIETVILIWCANRVGCPWWVNVVLCAVLLHKIFVFIVSRIMSQRIQEIRDKIIAEKVVEEMKGDKNG